MSLGGDIEFAIRTPVSEEQLAANVADCLSRGLPEVEFSSPQLATLTILANGPSAREYDFGGPTLALNGALKLCVERGVAPEYWAACDPQEHVADFLQHAPAETSYLVCSKCHPSVFEALKDRRVLVWHLDDFGPWDLIKDRNPVSLGVSITIVAFELAERLGYSTFETWGWDGCYVGGQSHAMAQEHGGSDSAAGGADAHDAEDGPAHV